MARRGVELLTTYITVAVETSNIAKQIGASLGDVERNVAPKYGKRIGSSLFKGVTDNVPDLKRLEREFADSQKRIVQAEERSTQKLENLARKVEIAQQAKAEAMEKYGESHSTTLRRSDQLILAEQRLEAATQEAAAEQARLADESAKAGEALDNAKSQVKDFGGAADSASDDVAKMAREMAQAESMAERMDGALDKATQKIGKGLKRATQVGVGALASVATYAGFKGWDRLLNIEDAQAKLKGLGHSIESVEDITNSALAAVEGTPYAMDEAVTTASGLLAAGVGQGEELERILGLVADSATLSGSSMGEMGAVWNKVFASGRIQAQEMNQLADRGFPIYQVLAEHMGTTVDEVRRLGSQGQISAADFADAMSTYEGAAKNAGDTTRGAIANFQTALAKLGADVLEPLQPHIKKLFDDGKGFVRKITPDVVAATEWIIDTGKRLIDWIKENETTIKNVGITAGAMVLAFLGARKLTQATAALKGLSIGIGAVGQALKLLMKANWIGLLVAAVAGAVALIIANWDTLGPKFQAVWNNYLKPVVDAIWSAMQEHLIPVFDKVAAFVMNTLWPAMQTAWQWISDAIKVAWEQVIKPALSALWGFIKNTLIPIFEWLWAKVVKPVWDFISWHIEAAWNTIKLVFDIFKAGIGFLGDKFEWLKNNVITPVWDWISEKIDKAWGKIKPIFEAIKDWLDKYLGPAFNTFKDVAVGAFEGLANLLIKPVQFIVNTVYSEGIKKVFDAVAEAVGSSARLPSAHIGNISFRSQVPKGGRGAAGGSTRLSAYARGGYAPPGWALVGEEGPELIDLKTPGRVYTAKQTREMIGLTEVGAKPENAIPTMTTLATGSESQIRKLAGTSPRNSMVAAGGDSVADRIGAAWSKTWRGALEVTKTIGGKAFKFARGALAKTAELVVSPLRRGLTNNVKRAGTIGSIAAGAINNSIDSLLSWVRGKDEEDRKTLEKMTSGGQISPAMMGALATMPLSGNSYRPVAGGTLTSLFGPRWGGHHAGVDWAVPVGTPFRAWRDGIVTSAGWNALAGRTGIGIALAHASGLGSYGGHLSRALVSAGQTVRAGQVIGLTGNTGRSTGPHLHFEISVGGNPHRVVNPLSYLFDRGGWIQPGTTTVVNKTSKPEAVLTNEQWGNISRLAGVDGPGVLGGQFSLVVEGQEFPAYVVRKAGEHPGVAAASDFVANHNRYSRMGV